MFFDLSDCILSSLSKNTCYKKSLGVVMGLDLYADVLWEVLGFLGQSV